MSCETKSVIYLISCKLCGVQYIGETSQPLRKRMNNHRSRLNDLCDLYIYKHFSSDGHSLEDLCVTPLEEVRIEGRMHVFSW